MRAIGRVVLAPIKLLFLPEKALGLFHDRGIQVENRSRRSKRKRQNQLHRILSFPIRVLLFPAFLYKLADRRRRLKDLLFLIPAALIICLFLFVAYQKSFRQSGLHQRYLARATKAVGANELVKAKTYINRIMQEQESLSDAQALHWIVILGRTGEEERANTLLNRLAPDNEPGYGPAHRVKAINLAQSFKGKLDELPADQLKFHLEHSGQPDDDIRRCWAIYHQSQGDFEQAYQLLNKAADSFPDLYFDVIELARELGDDARQEEGLKTAEYRFRRQTEKEPLDQNSRINWVKVLVQKQQFDEAEKVLLVGMNIQPTPAIRRSLSDLFLLRAEDMEYGSLQADLARLELIKKAIEVDRDSARPYQQLVDLFSSASSFNELRDMRQSLLKSIARGGGALDHCNLAFVYSRESNDEESRWHMNQAWKINSGFGSIAEQLALAFAKSPEHQNLNWAAELAKQTVEQRPEEPSYRKSLAEIHLLRDEIELAIEQLKKALAITETPSDIHKMLAYAYEQAGDLKNAEIHARQALMDNSTLTAN